VGVREAVTALLFDFDGTIVDTSSVWRETMGATFASHGYELDDELLDRLLASPWQAALPTLSEADAAAIEARLVDSMEKAYLECPPAPGLEPLLDQFADLPKAIVTSSYRERLVAPYLRRNGLEDRFDVVVGSEDCARLKPDPEAVRLALERLDVGRSGVWLIGDSAADVEAARAAGIGSVGVGSRAIGADLAADSLDAVASLLRPAVAEEIHRPPRRGSTDDGRAVAGESS
jgi:HAD superfamily hydrolase (TIGR01509 family)